MDDHAAVPTYGVREQTPAGGPVERAVESLRLLGYATLDGGYNDEELTAFAERFDCAHETAVERYGGIERLREIDEHNTVRALLSFDEAFLSLARNPRVMEVCRALLGDYFILCQQNGIINPPDQGRYNQALFHRDLPYQHFVSSRPIALNALFCIDAFTPENGATKVVPGSHRQEQFPSDAIVRSVAQTIKAPRGHFLVLDCMTFHSGGVNETPTPRRAVNHLYALPFIKQQIALPAILNASYAKNPETARLLGFGSEPARSLEDYYASRQRKLG